MLRLKGFSVSVQDFRGYNIMRLCLQTIFALLTYNDSQYYYILLCTTVLNKAVYMTASVTYGWAGAVMQLR